MNEIVKMKLPNTQFNLDFQFNSNWLNVDELLAFPLQHLILSA